MVANKLLTLAFVQEPKRILLGCKKTGFGAGKWNGFGGKVERGESIETAAKRELFEECGLQAQSVSKIGLLLFEFIGDPQIMEVHVFSADNCSGIITESNEMRPQWFEKENLPFDDMWADDRHWFPLMLQGSKFYGYFLYKDLHTITKHTLHELNTMEDIPEFCRGQFG